MIVPFKSIRKIRKIRKIPSLVYFHSLYQLSNSQRNGLKLWISNVKICMDK